MKKNSVKRHFHGSLEIVSSRQMVRNVILTERQTDPVLQKRDSLTQEYDWKSISTDSKELSGRWGNHDAKDKVV
jgi:hypothetical protein